MNRRQNKRSGKKGPCNELNNPSTLRTLATDSATFAQEMIYQHVGTGLRNQSLRIEMIFPSEKRSGKGIITVSPVFVEIESGKQAGVRTEISYQKMLSQLERRGYTSLAED